MRPGRLLSIGILTGLAVSSFLTAQPSTIQVIDVVEFRSYVIKFNEVWIISAQRAGLEKRVEFYSVFVPGDPEAESDSLRRELGSVAAGMGGGSPVRIRKFNYEFELADPVTGQKNNLHAPLSRLVDLHSLTAKKYDLQQQLWSVRFKEEWMMDPGTLEITKKTTTLIPVIWQRRKTTDGEPVNDAETGLPVYYKVELEPLLLRNP